MRARDARFTRIVKVSSLGTKSWKDRRWFAGYPDGSGVIGYSNRQLRVVCVVSGSAFVQGSLHVMEFKNAFTDCFGG